MESIQQWLTRNQHQSLDQITQALRAKGYKSQEISNFLKTYIDYKDANLASGQEQMYKMFSVESKS